MSGAPDVETTSSSAICISVPRDAALSGHSFAMYLHMLPAGTFVLTCSDLSVKSNIDTLDLLWRSCTELLLTSVKQLRIPSIPFLQPVLHPCSAITGLFIDPCEGFEVSGSVAILCTRICWCTIDPQMELNGHQAGQPEK